MESGVEERRKGVEERDWEEGRQREEEREGE
jgi:hypothetical protein